jgi:alkanesulfonate monooxygenase SsuD/methylene tetrahydromethanopterin reductase-like flavin-dependent oxidoreductase (luciferase family)
MTAVSGKTRVGCVYRPQFPPEQLAGAARAADAAGVDELWLWEDCFLSAGISAAAIALSHSEHLTVGVGVLPVPMRNVALTAMEIATLSRAFPGRVRIGVGHGVQDWMAQIGVKVASPMTLLREYLTCLSTLLRGESVTYTGRYVSLSDVRLDWPPPAGTELLAAATGPKTLKLTGELATGTVLTGGTTPDEVRAAVTQIDADGPHSVVVFIPCAIGPGAEELIRSEIRHWEFDETKPAADLAVYGEPAAIALGARRWVAAGADTVVLQPTAEADIHAFVDIVGNQIRPLLQQ